MFNSITIFYLSKLNVIECQYQIEMSAFLQNRNFRFFNINNIVKSATVSRDGLPGVSMEL